MRPREFMVIVLCADGAALTKRPQRQLRKRSKRLAILELLDLTLPKISRASLGVDERRRGSGNGFLSSGQVSLLLFKITCWVLLRYTLKQRLSMLMAFML